MTSSHKASSSERGDAVRGPSHMAGRLLTLRPGTLLALPFYSKKQPDAGIMPTWDHPGQGTRWAKWGSYCC